MRPANASMAPQVMGLCRPYDSHTVRSSHQDLRFILLRYRLRRPMGMRGM